MSLTLSYTSMLIWTDPLGAQSILTLKCKIKRLETYEILYLKKDFIFDRSRFVCDLGAGRSASHAPSHTKSRSVITKILFAHAHYW